MIIIDGRYRKQCLLTAREVVDARGVVILHDASRPHYRPGIRAFPHGRFVSGGRRWGGQAEFLTWIGTIDNIALVEKIANNMHLSTITNLGG